MFFRMFLAATAMALVGHAAGARDLTVALRGGALQDALRRVVVEPFGAATGLPVAVETSETGIGVLRAKVEGGANDWDLVLVDGDTLLAGCDGGLFEKLNWAAVGGRDHFLPQGASDCGVGAAASNLVLSWDKEKFQATPSWADFWDVAKFPGKRGLRRGVKLNLEIALMADGVALSDVYKQLRTDEGVDRAFRKLDQIKPYVAWWQSTDQAAQFLRSGDVLLSAATNTRMTAVNRADGRRFGIQWAGSLASVQSWAVVKGSPHLADAQKLLAFANDPARQAALTAAVPYGGLAKGASEGLSPEQLALSPTSPNNLAASLPVDELFWRDNLDRLSQRFDAWLAR